MTSISYTYDGVTTDYQVPFGFISEAHLNVYVAGTQTDEWDLINGTTVRLRIPPLAPLADDTILIERATPINTALVDFQSNAGIRERELDIAFNQVLYALQELDIEATTGLRKNGPGTAWDGESLTLKDLGAPADATDAATKGYVDTAVAGDGILPTPTVDDIGRGIRIRSGPSYEIGAVSGAVAVFEMTDGPVGELYSQPVVNNAWGSAWVSEATAEIPFTAGDTHLEPETGPITLSGNDIILPDRGKYEVTVIANFRNKVSGVDNGIYFVNLGLISNDGVTTFDKVEDYHLGADVRTSAPLPGPGQPTFAWIGQKQIVLQKIIDVTTGNLRINLRATSGSGTAGQVRLDRGTRIVVRELPQ